MKKYAVIVAGGKGERMKSNLPKQFLQLAGRPVLMHTVEVFYEADRQTDIVVVLPEQQREVWQDLVDQYEFSVPHRVVSGGSSRFQSVKQGLAAISDRGVVAIHDGVRPLVTRDVLQAAYQCAVDRGNAVVAVKLKDSLRQVIGEETQAMDRENYRLVQTPQVFEVGLIKSAYKNAGHDRFTDDASVIENAGVEVCLVEGSYDNIKITTAEDMVFAEAIVKTRG